MQINCPCCGNACEIESEPIVGQHLVCPFCSGRFSYADDGKQNEDRHRGDVLEEYLHKKIVIRCPECGTEYEIDNDAIGSKCQCGICNRDFIARDDSSVEIGEAQERDGIAGTGELDVEDKDDIPEQSGKDLPTKERSTFFTQTFLLVVKAKNRISALWKLGVGRISVILTKKRMNAVCLKAKEISTETKNQFVRLWKSGMKGKALLCALAALVVWLGFFLMCGGGPKAGEVSAKFRAYDFAVGDTSDLGNSSFRKKKGIKASDVSECFDKHRKGSVFRYHTIDDDDKTSTKDIKVSRIAVATEQYKRIVKTEDGWTFSTGVSGAAEVAELIYGYIEMVTTRACKGEIVASSPNVKYLGLSEAELKKELTSVYIKTALNGGGSFGIQWKRSDGNYVAWQCCIATKGDMVIDMLAFTVSDILVREDTFGNEECESKVGAEVEFERGRCFAKGDGVNKDMYEAVKWYRKAAERGYAPAQFSLGCCYHSGHGVDKNSAEAVKWIRKAAEQGIAVAQSYLAICYEQGDGVSMDKQESLKWYRKAADGGHAHSQYILGLCYWSGDGLIQNSIEAEKWLVKAAEQGHVEAQYTLGKFYGLSDGGPRNTTEAIKWLRKASNQGHKGAKVLLDILVK